MSQKPLYLATFLAMADTNIDRRRLLPIIFQGDIGVRHERDAVIGDIVLIEQAALEFAPTPLFVCTCGALGAPVRLGQPVPGARELSVTLFVEYQERDEREKAAELLRTDGIVKVVVSDNGEGFDGEHAADLFLPFRRLHDASDFPGSGVGLATVQRIVALHGGEVWFEATEGAGARFSFSLPDPAAG